MLSSCDIRPLNSPSTAPEPVPVVPKELPPAKVHFLQAKGARIVDGDGREVILRGCNLGNWLLLEMWMLEIKEARDQYEFEAILEQRFGPAGKDELMELYRSNWITKRDFPLIRSFGFNTIRLPFNYRLLAAEDGPLVLRPEAFKWLDWAVEMARKYKLHVILDLHGLPGGQSVDHTTGRAGQNKLWTQQEHQQRTVWLWQQIAEHYRDEPVIAAYDLINEPFGDYKTTNHLAALAGLCGRMYEAIRSVDTNHIVLFPGSHQGLDFYGTNVMQGRVNLGFTEHYYPGLFGDETSVESHARFIARRLPSRQAFLERMGAPFLIGEFNVVFEKVGGAPLMRYYYDRYASNGWAATMWSYKLLKEKGGIGRDSWAMVVNQEPLPPVSIKKSPRAEIEALFRWFGTMPYSVNEPLGAAMTQKEPPPLFLPELPVYPSEPAARDEWPGWQGVDVHGALPGGQKVYSENDVDLFAGGSDIWAVEDQFRFLCQPVNGDFELGARILSLDETHEFAKAGLMLRRDTSPNSPHLLLNVFPGGDVVLGWRAEKGGTMDQRILGRALFPVHLRMRRRGDMIDVAYSSDGKDWEKVRVGVSDGLGRTGLAGLAALSHDNRVLTKASFKSVLLKR